MSPLLSFALGVGVGLVVGIALGILVISYLIYRWLERQ